MVDDPFSAWLKGLSPNPTNPYSQEINVPIQPFNPYGGLGQSGTVNIDPASSQLPTLPSLPQVPNPFGIGGSIDTWAKANVPGYATVAGIGDTVGNVASGTVSLVNFITDFSRVATFVVGVGFTMIGVSALVYRR